MDDLISREVVKKELEELIRARRHWLSDGSGEIRGIEVAYCAIDGIPSAQKKGHWIDTNPDEPLDPRQTCSECGNTEILHSANFCPNCGADMREEANE